MLRLLMIVSMLMLGVFSGYWLHTQYQDERQLLQEDLETAFREAGDEVLDSLLMAVYIKPALNDSVNLTIDIRGGAGKGTKVRPPAINDIDHVVVRRGKPVDTGFVENMTVERGTPVGMPRSEMMTVERDTSIAGGPQKIQVFRSPGDSLKARDFLWKEEEMLVRSFKLVMSHTSGNQVTDSIELISMDGTGTYTAMLHGRFTSKVKDRNPNFQVHWVAVDPDEAVATDPAVSVDVAEDYESSSAGPDDLNGTAGPDDPITTASSGPLAADQSEPPGHSAAVEFDITTGTDTTGVSGHASTGPDQMLVTGASVLSATPAVVSGVFLYLLKETLPQIIFILLLLGLSFTAFILMFRTMKKQYELNVLRQDMVTNMTHELKTPVSTMKVALEALDVFRAGNDAASAKEYMGIANQEIDRLDQLIARMLDQVTLEGRERIVKKEKVDLREIADECVQVIKPRIDERNGSVSVMVSTPRTDVPGDRWYIAAALTNLLDNSLKYSGDNPDIAIEIEAVDKQHVQLRVHDNGPGIPRKYARKVFEKFFRVPMGDIHNVKGHGLGLSFVAQVMKQHDGRAFQENSVPAGCSFILEFRQSKNGN